MTRKIGRNQKRRLQYTLKKSKTITTKNLHGALGDTLDKEEEGSSTPSASNMLSNNEEVKEIGDLCSIESIAGNAAENSCSYSIKIVVD